MLFKPNHKHFFLIQAILLSIYLPIFSGGGRFLIQPSTAADCSSCGRSGGTCVYDRSSGSTVCHKHSHVRLLAGAEAPAPFPSQGVKFTLVNNCSETVWAAILSVPGSPNLESTGFELPIGSSRTIDAPTRWNGRFWGRTNCTFNDSGNVTCATGDTVATLAEFGLGVGSADFYDVSLVNGFNLPLRVDPVGGSGRCNSTGCVVDLNRRCPEELRADGGRACRSACNAFNTTVHCCSGTTCRPTLYSQLFKDACPLAFSYATDDATSTFTCSTAANYAIIFCASSIPGQNLSKLDDGTDIGLGPSPEPTSPRTSSRETSSPVPIIVAVILCVTGAILAIMIICYCIKRRSSEGSDQVINQDIENLLLQQGSLALKRYKYSEIKKITKSFNEKLGQGGYGSVYKGVLPDGSLVAVKVLIEADSNGEEFINEVASISRTSHVNIVNLLGFCFGRNKRALVYQYMPNKSLDKFITNKDSPLDLETLYKIAVGVAKGLEYLHTGCNTRIVHFDIKPQNILLDEDFCPKISDFGLAKLGKKKQSVISMLGTRGTIGYIAPEVFSRNFGGVSYKSDVYSYGMMVLEMVGRNSIMEVEAFESSTENYFPDKIYEQVVLDVTKRLDGFTFEEELEETANTMLLVGFWCIQTSPSERPSMSKVVEMLEGSLQSIQIPPKPVLWTPTLPATDDSSSFSTFVETENSANVLTI